MDPELIKSIVPLLAKALAAVGAVAAGVWAVYVYSANSRVRRAEWIASLYEKFYERTELRNIREALDCEGGDSAEIRKLVEAEGPEFSDYLNFFEFVAVLQKSSQLTHDEIEDLFGYYLDCLENCGTVRIYIAKKGYEQLDRLLQERAQQG
jgi:hypothetical protein